MTRNTLYSTLLYSTLLYSTLLYSTLLYYTLYSTILYTIYYILAGSLFAAEAMLQRFYDPASGEVLIGGSAPPKAPGR